MLKQRKYEGMYFRVGVIDDSDDSMDWMEPDYDDRTLKDITESSSVAVLLENLIDIFVLDTPNIEMLSTSLGEFTQTDGVLFSKKVYNRNISDIELHSIKTSNFSSETSKVIIRIIEKTLLKKDFETTLKKYSLELLDNEMVIAKVENSLVSFNAELNMRVLFNNDYVDTVILSYS